MAISLEAFHDMSIDEQKALLAKFQEQRKVKLTLKVSDKGAISVYGMGRFPTTLYANQWKRIVESGQEILDFIDRNIALLSSKD